MIPRGLLTTIGAAALGVGIVVGSAAGMPYARAQEATPSTQTPAQRQQQQANEFDAQRAQAYDDFVAALASELGDDAAAVDAAIRTALKQEVDKRQAAGDLDVERAAAMKAVIDVSDAPLFSGFGGHGGPHGFDGRGDFDGHGPGGGRGDDSEKTPGGATLPSAKPGDEQGADQTAPAPAVPALGTAIV